MGVHTFCSRIRLYFSVIGVHQKETLFFLQLMSMSLRVSALIENHSRITYRKLNFMFGYAAPDTDQKTSRWRGSVDFYYRRREL